VEHLGWYEKEGEVKPFYRKRLQQYCDTNFKPLLPTTTTVDVPQKEVPVYKPKPIEEIVEKFKSEKRFVQSSALSDVSNELPRSGASGEPNHHRPPLAMLRKPDHENILTYSQTPHRLETRPGKRMTSLERERGVSPTPSEMSDRFAREGGSTGRARPTSTRPDHGDMLTWTDEAPNQKPPPLAKRASLTLAPAKDDQFQSQLQRVQDMINLLSARIDEAQKPKQGKEETRISRSEQVKMLNRIKLQTAREEEEMVGRNRKQSLRASGYDLSHHLDNDPIAHRSEEDLPRNNLASQNRRTHSAPPVRYRT
jgi:hypothetical protein